MDKSLTAGRIVTGIIGVYHVLAGCLLLFSGEMSIQAAKELAGWTVQGSPEMGVMGEILGCYILAFGLMMLMAARNPVEGKSCITVGLILIGLRLMQRLYFSRKVVEIFQVPAARHWGAFAVVGVLGLCLLAFRLQLARRPPGATA